MVSAKALFASGQYDDCYGMVHVAIEAELKALIMKERRYNAWPDRSSARELYTHDLATLLSHTEAEEELNARMAEDREFRLSWRILKDMQINARYSLGECSMEMAQETIQAAENGRYGVGTWLRTR